MSASWGARMTAVLWVMSAAGTVWSGLVFLDMVCTLGVGVDGIWPVGCARGDRRGGGVNPCEPPRWRRISPRAAASSFWGEIRRSRAGAAQVSVSEPQRRTGVRDQRRGLTPTGPGRSRWAGADGKLVSGSGGRRQAAVGRCGAHSIAPQRIGTGAHQPSRTFRHGSGPSRRCRPHLHRRAPQRPDENGHRRPLSRGSVSFIPTRRRVLGWRYRRLPSRGRTGRTRCDAAQYVGQGGRDQRNQTGCVLGTHTKWSKSLLVRPPLR
jgi:hypothetical protein